MAKTQRITPELKAKIIMKKLERPRESGENIVKSIEQETGVVLNTTSVYKIIERYIGKHLGEVDQVKQIIDQDLSTLLAGTAVANLKLSDLLDKIMSGQFTQVDLGKLASILSDATKRHQLFTGGATENLAVAAKTYLPEKEAE